MNSTLRSSVAAVALAFLAVLAFSTVAGAQEGNYGAYVGSEPGTGAVKPLVLTSVTERKAQLPAPEVKSETLAITGSNSTMLALVGTLSVLVGGSILVIRRRVATN